MNPLTKPVPEQAAVFPFSQVHHLRRMACHDGLSLPLNDFGTKSIKTPVLAYHAVVIKILGIAGYGLEQSLLTAMAKYVM